MLQKTPSRKWKDNSQNGRNICKSYVWSESNIQDRTKNQYPISKWAKVLIRHISKVYVCKWPILHKKMLNCIAAAAAAKSLQSCLTLCDPIDSSPSGSPIPGILQARILEWVAISFSNAWKWKVKVKSLSHAQLLATPWTWAYQAPPSMGFSRQEYWSGLPLPSPLVTIELC